MRSFNVATLLSVSISKLKIGRTQSQTVIHIVRILSKYIVLSLPCLPIRVSCESVMIVITYCNATSSAYLYQSDCKTKELSFSVPASKQFSYSTIEFSVMEFPVSKVPIYYWLSKSVSLSFTFVINVLEHFVCYCSLHG